MSSLLNIFSVSAGLNMRSKTGPHGDFFLSALFMLSGGLDGGNTALCSNTVGQPIMKYLPSFM